MLVSTVGVDVVEEVIVIGELTLLEDCDKELNEVAELLTEEAEGVRMNVNGLLEGDIESVICDDTELVVLMLSGVVETGMIDEIDVALARLDGL